MITLSDIKRSLGSLLLLFISLLGAAFLSFLTQLILGRTLSVESFGIITTGLSLVAIGTAIVGYGVPSYWLLRYGEEGVAAARWLKPSLTLIVIIAPVICSLIWVYTNYFIDNPIMGWAMTWLLSLVILQVMFDLLAAKLQIEGRYKTLSAWQIVIHLSRLLVVLIAYFLNAISLDFVVLGYTTSAAILIICIYVELRKLKVDLIRLPAYRLRNNKYSFAKVGLKDVLFGAWPFAATTGLGILYSHTEIVLLGTIKGMEAAGMFSVAAAFLLVAYLVPQTVFQKFLLPKIHRWYNQDRSKFVASYKFNTAAMLLMGAVGTIVIYLSSESLVPAVFGEKYSLSGHILSGLALCVLFRFVSTSVGSSLISGDNMRRKVYCQMIVAIVSVITASVFIYLYGLKGAVISKVITEFILLVSYLYTSSRYVLGQDAWRGWSLRVQF